MRSQNVSHVHRYALVKIEYTFLEKRLTISLKLQNLRLTETSTATPTTQTLDCLFARHRACIFFQG